MTQGFSPDVSSGDSLVDARQGSPRVQGVFRENSSEALHAETSCMDGSPGAAGSPSAPGLLWRSGDDGVGVRRVPAAGRLQAGYRPAIWAERRIPLGLAGCSAQDGDTGNPTWFAASR